nr:proline-rich protein 36-like [Aegilops tauschii subsp. strangulata]
MLAPPPLHIASLQAASSAPASLRRLHLVASSSLPHDCSPPRGSTSTRTWPPPRAHRCPAAPGRLRVAHAPGSPLRPPAGSSSPRWLLDAASPAPWSHAPLLLAPPRGRVPRTCRLHPPPPTGAGCRPSPLSLGLAHLSAWQRRPLPVHPDAESFCRDSAVGCCRAPASCAGQLRPAIRTAGSARAGFTGDPACRLPPQLGRPAPPPAVSAATRPPAAAVPLVPTAQAVKEMPTLLAAGFPRRASPPPAQSGSAYAGSRALRPGRLRSMPRRRLRSTPRRRLRRAPRRRLLPFGRLRRPASYATTARVVFARACPAVSCLRALAGSPLQPTSACSASSRAGRLPPARVCRLPHARLARPPPGHSPTRLTWISGAALRLSGSGCARPWPAPGRRSCPAPWLPTRSETRAERRKE